MSWPLRIATLSKGGSFYAGWGLAFDFVNNKYRVGVGRGYSSSFLEQPGVTYARTGADLLSYNPVTGKWQAFAANVPAILAGAGQDIAEGTTNKCTNYNAAPTDLTNVSKSGDAAATLTVVDDTAALRAAGFGALIDAGKMNGKVYKLDNSLGSTAAFAAVSGVTGNTNTHTLSVWARYAGALGSAVRYETAVAVNSAITTTTYARAVVTGAPGSAADRLQMRVAPGSVVYFILNQLEEKPYATNPAIVAGASASRGAATPVVTGLASLLTPPFTLVAVANLSAIDGVDRYFMSVNDASPNNDVTLRRSTTNFLRAGVTAGGSGIGVNMGSAITGPRLAKAAIRIRPSEWTPSANGVNSTPQSVSAPTGMLQMILGQSRVAGLFTNSPLLFAGIAPDLTDAQLQALTASNGLLTDFL